MFAALIAPRCVVIVLRKTGDFVARLAIIRDPAQVSVGLAPDFIRIWLGAWGLSWLVAFPTLLAVLPIVRRATAAIVDQP